MVTQSQDVTEVADALYALTPEEFTAARNARVKETRAESKGLSVAIQGLRKPSPGAWVVNSLVRHRAEQIDDILTLGASLREAQEDLDRDALAELTKQRRQLVQALAKQAGVLAEGLGHPVTGTVLDEVAQTLQAGMVDADAASAILSGRLLRSLATVGTEVDLTDAVAVPDGRMPAAKAPKKPAVAKAEREAAAKREREEAQREATQTEVRAKEAAEALDEVERSMAKLGRQRDALRDELHDLEEQVAAVNEDIAAAKREARDLDRERAELARASDLALRESDRASDRLARLSRDQRA